MKRGDHFETEGSFMRREAYSSKPSAQEVRSSPPTHFLKKKKLTSSLSNLSGKITTLKITITYDLIRFLDRIEFLKPIGYEEDKTTPLPPPREIDTTTTTIVTVYN